MAITLEAPEATVRRQSVTLCVLVGAGVVVGWVLYRHYWSDDVYQRIVQWDWFAGHFWAVTLLVAVVLSVPYAIVLLVWGRGLTRGVAGAAAALGAGFFIWAWDRVFSNYIWDAGHQSHTSLRVYLWGTLLVTATLVPLAWGLARRSGRRWPLGLVAGPVVAAILRELQLRWSWWQQHVLLFGQQPHWQIQAVVFMAPFVVAVLACWAIEARGRRTPQMESSGSATPRRG
jgi:hypothetical protein